VVDWTYFPLSTLPAPYEVVWCRFPHHPDLGDPGPWPRPALIRNSAVDENGNGEVEVVYGTTNLKFATRKFDFIVSKQTEMDLCGLWRATRFDLDNLVWLPWAEEWFETLPTCSSPILGRLSDEAIRMLQLTLAYKQRDGQ
jgi:hypothetical protein